MYYLWKSGLPQQGCGYSSYFRGSPYLFSPRTHTRCLRYVTRTTFIMVKKKNGFIGIFTRRKKKKCYRCKFKTNKLNAQLGHVCFVFFCFSFSLSTVCPFLPGGGGKKTLLMLYACMSSARRPSLLVSSEELGVLEARHRLEGSPCLVQCQESFKSSSLSPF